MFSWGVLLLMFWQQCCWSKYVYLWIRVEYRDDTDTILTCVKSALQSHHSRDPYY